MEIKAVQRENENLTNRLELLEQTNKKLETNIASLKVSLEAEEKKIKKETINNRYQQYDNKQEETPVKAPDTIPPPSQ